MANIEACGVGLRACAVIVGEDSGILLYIYRRLENMCIFLLLGDDILGLKEERFAFA